MYKCLSQQKFEDDDGYSLVSIHLDDMESIRIWRNAQIDVLRQRRLISPEEQKEYFLERIYPTFGEEYPEQVLFSFKHKGNTIGYGGLTHIDWEAKRGEVSFLLDPILEVEYDKAFTSFLGLLSTVAFKYLKMNKIFTETWGFRYAHIQILENFGFQLEGKLKSHIMNRGILYDSVFHSLFKKDYRPFA